MPEKSKTTKTSAKKTETAAKAKTSSKKTKDKNAENKYLTYNGKMLIRSGNEIIYGNPTDKYMVLFRLEDCEPLGNIEISKRVIIELKTNEGKQSQLIRQAEREGLYRAFDIGMFWLEQALENG